MKQFIYIVLLLIGFQAGAITTDDSSTVSTSITLNGGNVTKQMGNRVYMKSSNPKVCAIKCEKNPRIVCAYVRSAVEEDGGGLDRLSCPSMTNTFIPEPYYSMLGDPAKTYLGIPDVQGGVKYYEVNSVKFDCSAADGENGSVLIQFDPPLDLEGE
jgi:hypothetical protein